MRIGIGGGRDYWPTKKEIERLEELYQSIPITGIVSGGAPGVDTFAIQFASSKSIKPIVFKAPWGLCGPSSGRLRNRQMLNVVDGWIFFKGGRGTQDMIRLVIGARLPRWFIGDCYLGKYEDAPKAN
jgi:hypothetical protein